MNCPVHVSRAMVLVSAARPFFGMGGRRKYYRYVNKTDGDRKILRCPVPDCPRVMTVESTFVKLHDRFAVEYQEEWNGC